jgi:hypothetical protein
MLSLKFPVTMATRGHLKIGKKHYFALIFSIKIDSKCCNFSMDWDRVKGFLALITSYLMVHLGSFLASHSPKFAWRWGGLPPPFKPPKQKGAHPPSGNPLIILLYRGRRRKSCHFFKQHFPNEKQCLGPKKGNFSLSEASKKRGCRKAVNTRLYEVKD